MQINVRSKGFSLVELMIAVAIIGILAGIALPSYQDHIKKTRRQDAEAALLQFRQAMEKFYANRFTYLGAAVSPTNKAPAIFPQWTPLDTPAGGTKYYNLTIDSASATSFTLKATATGSQVGEDCGDLTLSSNGTKSATGSGTDCWG